MNETKFKILTTLIQNIGDSISINKLTNCINNNYKNSYYNNIYYKIKDLEIDNDIFIDKIGKSSIINLNFDNPILIDLLSQVELRKKDFHHDSFSCSKIPIFMLVFSQVFSRISML